MIDLASRAKQAAIALATLGTAEKNNVIERIADSLDAHRKEILTANKEDVQHAEGLSKTLLKRLELNDTKINEIISGVKDLAKLEDPVGKTQQAIELDTDLTLYRVTCPIGVIGVIFESRPDALVQIASLCFKSGNAVLLKGGSEAQRTNALLTELISKETDSLVEHSTQLLTTREDVRKMLDLHKYIDLIIPRGSNEFVRYIQDNSKIAVMGHSDGICHTYIDVDADVEKALTITVDAKCQYPAVCNATETVLIHEKIAQEFLPKLTELLKNVELRGDTKARAIVPMNEATEEDWKTEYTDLILSIKIVTDVSEAIQHINTYGSKHTDAILTENKSTAKNFLMNVDASSVLWNCSTRFSDGYRYGKGCEVGVSTGKLHARGPVGLNGLVTYKYYLVGDGQVVGSYSGENAKSFTHKLVDKQWNEK